MEKDMTAGTPGKIIFNFTMPIFIEIGRAHV